MNMDTDTRETNTREQNVKAILAVMPVLPTSTDLAERLATLQAEASAALSYANEQVQLIATGAEAQASAEDIQNALVYADEQVQALQSLAEEAHAALAAVASYAKEVTEQRDMVVQAYKRAFEHGILHAYECEACMEDAHIENLAERMLEESPEEIAISEQEILNEALVMAEDLYAEWVSEEIAGVRPDVYDRTELLGLVEASGGIDTDEVYSMPAAQIADDQKLISSLAGEDSDEEDDSELDTAWLGDDFEDDDSDEAQS